jgi:hypothetical protein
MMDGVDVDGCSVDYWSFNGIVDGIHGRVKKEGNIR